MSTLTTIVNAPKQHVLPLPAGKYGKSTKRSTQQCHQATEGNSGFEAAAVGALRGLGSLRSKTKLVAGGQRETHFLSKEENDIWIEDCIDRETAEATKRVEDAEIAVQQKQEDVRKAENAELTNREPEKTVQEMIVALRDSLSDLVSSDDVEDGEDEDDEETEQGNLREDDEAGWVTGTISKMVQQRIERFRQKQIKLDELTQPGRQYTANYVGERDRRYVTSELMVASVVERQTDNDPAIPALTPCGGRIERLDIVPGISQVLQRTSRPWRSYTGLGCGNPQSSTSIPGLAPAAEPHSLLIEHSKPAELLSFYPCV